MKKIIILFFITMTLTACANTSLPNPTTTPNKEETELSDVKIVDDAYKSEFEYEVIKYTPDSRHYSVQQISDEVSLESATSIVRELYSKEAFADNGGVLGNVVIYDNTVQLKKDESPAFEIEEKAEYSSGSRVIHFGGMEHPFEPAYK